MYLMKIYVFIAILGLAGAAMAFVILAGVLYAHCFASACLMHARAYWRIHSLGHGHAR